MTGAIAPLSDLSTWARGKLLVIVLLVLGAILLTRLADWARGRIMRRIEVDTLSLRMVARTLPGMQFDVGRDIRAGSRPRSEGRASSSPPSWTPATRQGTPSDGPAAHVDRRAHRGIPRGAPPLHPGAAGACPRRSRLPGGNPRAVAYRGRAVTCHRAVAVTQPFPERRNVTAGVPVTEPDDRAG